MCGTHWNNVISSLFSSATLAFRWRCNTPFVHGQTETPNASTQAIEFNQAVLVQLIQIGLVLSLEM